MSWDGQEWLAFVALLEGWWPGEFSEEAADAWRLALDGVEPRAAMVALKALLHEGRRFRPSASELLAEVRRDRSAPTFEEALMELRGVLGSPPRVAGLFESEAEKRAAENRVLLERVTDPLVRGFVERQGVGRLRVLPLDDPDEGKWVRKELAEAWERHVGASDGREVAAIATGTGGPRRLDPLGSLPGLGKGAV